MLKKTPLLLSTNENKLTLSDISDINSKINQENFDKSLILKEKDLNLFYLILKLTDNNTLSMIEFIVKNTNKKYKEKQIICKKEIRIFLMKQIFLLFKYLSLIRLSNIKKFIDLYMDLYNLIVKFQKSFTFIQLDDIVEIIRYNIIISMTDLLDKNYIFNTSINFLIDFYKNIINQKKKDENEMKILNIALIKFFETIYKNLLKNPKNLNFLQKYEDIEDLTLFNIIDCYRKNENELDNIDENEDLQKLNDIISKIILYVFSFNTSKLINEILLNDIKEGFFEVKKGNDIKIKNIINILSSKIHLINSLYLNEKELLENDIYFPKRYFVFNDSLYSGIDYNPEFNLFNYNFILMFSFKLSDNTKNYPLLTFISGENENNESEILLNISLQNKRLSLLCQNEYQESSDIEIQNDKSYFIIIEYYKNDLGFEKIKLIINNNEERKNIELGLIYYEKKILIKIGYLTEKLKRQNSVLANLSLNYSGIMGPIMILPDLNGFQSNVNKEKNEEFITNVSLLYGFYDNVMYTNKNYDLTHLYLYENFKIVTSQSFINANSYINNIINKFGTREYYMISPLSIINTNDNGTKIFIDNINGLKKIKNNKDIDTFFNTLGIPSKYTEATYAKINNYSIQSFIENDGMHILTLILEYYYNLLKMIINYSQYDYKLSITYDINNSLIPLFDLIANIIMFFQINLFSNDLDTFGFSLMKVINLLGDIKTLNSDLVKSINNNMDLLINFCNENISDVKIVETVRNFINKMFKLLCAPKYYNTDNFEQMKNIFRLFHEILVGNYELMNIETFKDILQFSFILDIEIDEDDDEKEFKSMKGEYKSLIELFIKQNESLLFYMDYLRNVFNKNISLKIKYKLIKIYYKSNEALSLLYNTSLSEEKSEKSEENKDNKDKSFWNIFKNKKETDKKKINLISKYESILTRILSMRYQTNQLNDKYHQLLICILIQLIYEQAIYSSKNNSDIAYLFFSEDNMNKRKETINKGMSIKNTIHQKSKSIKEMVKIRKTSNYPDGLKDTFSSFYGESEKVAGNVQYLFDKLLEVNNISFYVIKSLFCCLFDKWDRNDKFNYFKNNIDFKYESFESNFGNLTRNKKELISEFFNFVMSINNKEEMKKSLKLIFCFLKKCISEYKSIGKDKKIPIYNVRYYKKKFYHIFEAKNLMNKLFIFCLSKNNRYITDDLSEIIITNIINICNNVLEYHPRPFIFSFMKSSLKNKDIHKNIYHIFRGIFEYIINNLKKDSEIVDKNNFIVFDEDNRFNTLENKEEEKDKENVEVNSFLYFNQIRFIKCLVKLFNNYQIEIQKLLIDNEYKLLYSLQNLIIAFCSSKSIFDIRLYIFHPNSLIQDSSEKLSFNYNSNNSICLLSNAIYDEKAKEKYDIKTLQSLDTKMLSNQILILDLLELTFLTMYFLWTVQLDDKESSNQKLLHFFMKPIFEKIYIEEHFITYYLDIFNQKNYLKLAQKEKVSDSVLSRFSEDIPIKYQHWFSKNVAAKDNRIFSALLFLIILKYQSLLILYEKTKGDENKIETIRNIFNNNINLAQNDLFAVIQIIEKIKDNKKAEIIFEKEELNNKEFKNFNKNYYKYLLTYVNKYKNNIYNENVDNIKTELEKKYIKEEEDKKRMKLNWISDYKSNNVAKNDDLNKTIDIPNNNNLSIDTGPLQNYNAFKQALASNKTPQKKVNLPLVRKDSFKKYYKDEEEIVNTSKRLSSDFNYNNSISNLNISVNYKSESFIDAAEPILCTKRDLILNKFAYFYFDEVFKDERFIKMKNYFMCLYPSSNVNNNYNGFEKQMKIKYPSILKNFSNCENYYPRLFIRPDIKFFYNKNLYKSHEYLKIYVEDKKSKKKDSKKKINENNDNHIFNHIISEEENKIMHLEYGHGLLNQNNFNLFSAGNTKENLGAIAMFECEYINNRNTIQGNIKFIKHFIIFQTNKTFDFSQYETNTKYRISSRKEEIVQKEKQIIIPLKLIEQIICRNFLFYNQAIEIFLYNGKSYFFNLYESSSCTEFLNSLKNQYESLNINNEKEMCEIIENSIEYFNKKKYCNIWLEGKLPTLNYLLLINKYSGRSYNDLTQYLIFPWLLNNYSDIKDKNNYRKMNLSMAIQDQSNLEIIKKNYDNDKDLTKRSHFQYHYSNSSYINLYLVRLNPFTYNQIKQNGHFDSPDRQIESMQDMCIIFKDFKETSELIPEYFFMVECFLNLNFNFFGRKSCKNGKEPIVNNIKLTNNFSSLLELILFHQNLINSNDITTNINKWIDNIFGENQITTKKNVINSYPVDCYEKYVKEEVDQKVSQLNECISEEGSEDLIGKIKKLIKEIKVKTDYAYLFGQCPPQIFQKNHPIFSLLKKYKKATTNYEDNQMKNDAKISIPDKHLLYLDCKNANNNLFLLCTNEILVYNKTSLKLLQTLDINIINQPYSINIEDNNLFLKFLYQNLIFEIEDCKIFFIAGYLDNSYKIYYKEKDKENNDKETNMLSIITESQVTCIKNIIGKNIFFTGHRNGKIIKWKYELLFDNKNNKKEENILSNSSKIKIDKISYIIGHKSLVEKIEINETLKVLLSSSKDGFILIRKLFDYELLNIIKYNPLKRALLDFFFDKQIIITTSFNINEEKDKKIRISVFSVNGIKLCDLEQNISLPIILNEKTDEIIAFINCSLYKIKITFNEYTDLLVKLNEKKSDDNNNAENPTKSFINEINQNVPISLCYNNTFKVIYCLFQGQLYRINVKI